MLHTQEPHLPRVRDVGAEPLRLPEAEQVPAAATQVHSSNHAPGRYQGVHMKYIYKVPCKGIYVLCR